MARTTLIEVDVAVGDGDDLVAISVDGTAHPVQPTGYAPTVLSDERIDASRLERVLRRIRGGSCSAGRSIGMTCDRANWSSTSARPFVRIGTSFLNQSADHRLRLHVPLPVAAAMSAGSGQFAVTERGLTAEGGWGEYPIPTFPADEFVSVVMATVLLDHSTEYELVQGGSEFAITLLRAA